MPKRSIFPHIFHFQKWKVVQICIFLGKNCQFTYGMMVGMTPTRYMVKKWKNLKTVQDPAGCLISCKLIRLETCWSEKKLSRTHFVISNLLCKYVLYISSFCFMSLIKLRQTRVGFGQTLCSKTFRKILKPGF